MPQKTAFFLLRLLLSSALMLFLALLLPGFEVSGFFAAFIFALVLGLINAIIRPIVLAFTLPINILTVGLFTFVVNGLLFWLASVFVIGVQIETFAAAFWGALVMSLLSWITNLYIGDRKQNESKE